MQKNVQNSNINLEGVLDPSLSFEISNDKISQFDKLRTEAGIEMTLGVNDSEEMSVIGKGVGWFFVLKESR